MEFFDVVKLVITSSLISTFLGKLWDYFKEKNVSKAQKRFEALKIANTLEGYVIECANAISDQSMYYEENGKIGKLMNDIPPIPTIEISENLIAYQNGKLVNTLLQLKQDLNIHKEEIAFYKRVTDEDVLAATARSLTTDFALKCFVTAKELRRKAKLPERELVFMEYDVIDTLIKSITSFTDSLDKDKEHHWPGAFRGKAKRSRLKTEAKAI